MGPDVLQAMEELDLEEFLPRVRQVYEGTYIPCMDNIDWITDTLKDNYYIIMD
jgi:hypothetical protein